MNRELPMTPRGLVPLTAWLSRGRPEVGFVLSVAARCSAAVDALHRQGRIHGRLQPAVILTNEAGSVVELPDSPPAGGTADATYLAPEQTGRTNRAVDERSDLYALGVVLYELLTGTPPFLSSDPLELVHAHIARIPVTPALVAPSVPEAVSQIVMTLLAKEPASRYQTARGLSRDLDICARAWTASGSIAPFPLRQRDSADSLQIPKRLYGRDREADELRRTYDEAREGQGALLLVSGYSGVGKTSLISDLYDPLVKQGGYFVSGKFDQVVRNIPYGALSQAFRGLVARMLTESEEQLTSWRERLSAALGSNGGVLSEVIPEIELVLGPQDAPPRLEPAEAQNRFRMVFQSFVGTVARSGEPLVVFLDDLQWVDSATLELLHALLTSPDLQHLLLVCAYRDNEVDANHMLTFAVARMDAAGIRVRRVGLGPLGLQDLIAFLCDTLRRESSDVEPLARLVQQKTDGNPFFVIQFLRMLEQERYLTVDHDLGYWVYRTDTIARAGITDNVSELLTRKIERLSTAARQVLPLAACIGNTFGWKTLLTVSRQPPADASAGLAEMLDAGLVEPLTDPFSRSLPHASPAYAFLHDRVQQAAYGLIPEDQRRSVHLDVGRLMLAECAGQVPDDRLFEIVNHLNVGAELIAPAGERLEVARLNLAAGLKAKASAAYRAATEHLDAGIALLTPEHWLSHYGFMFQLHLEAAECRYLAGAFERAQDDLDHLLQRAASTVDQAQIHILKITLFENQSRWADAVESALDALRLFGITFPDTPEGRQAALDRELDDVQRALGARDIQSLVELPVMTDTDMRTAMRALTILWAPAYISGDQVLARLVSATMVRLSLSHGNTEDSAYGYVTHAITIGPVKEDYEAAYDWGQLALAINVRFGDVKRRAKIHQQFQAHVNLWRRPFETCLYHAREACRAGLEAGDLTYAGYGAATECWSAWHISTSLERFVRDYTPHLGLLAKIKMDDFFAAQRIMLNWAAALQGRTFDPFSLSDPSFDERIFVKTYESSAPFFLTFFYTAKLHLLYLQGEFALAHAAWKQARSVMVTGTMWPVLVDFWGSLTIAALYDDASETERATARGQLEAARHAMRVLDANCPENFRCFYQLLSAELHRIDGRMDEAAATVGDAVAYARETGNLQMEALASELGARLWLAREREGNAADMLREAHRAYLEWGATVKVAQLERTYPALIAARQRVQQAGAEAVPFSATSSALDVETVLRVARAIASEIQIEGLLRRLIQLAVENAGAERGLFLQERDGALLIEAEADTGTDRISVRQSIPFERADHLSHRVVRYVRRTGQDIVIGDTRKDERFAGDPHFATGGPRSLLCVPVGAQGQVSGMLYLENSLTSNAFTPERLEMMRILAAQAAISLENARLYEGTRAEIERRTTAELALRDAMTELKTLKDRLEAENVYLQEEIRTQHNFNEIVGNSPILLDTLRKVEAVAPTDSTVLITGETGSGKELIARAVHSRSRRSERPLVKVNCGAIAPGLVESELFGHVKGAFTGAIDKRVGRFELANGGTVFLDEVGELPLEAQVKLLRVLQEQEFEPVGSSRTVRVNVRVIAATNRKLDEAVREGRFRADLLYRLNVFPIEMAPLRERATDLRLLVGFFVAGLSRKLGKPLQGFSAQSMNRMMRYSWPGNVRELQNVIERAAILAKGPVLDLDPAFNGGGSEAVSVPAVLMATFDGTLDEVQRAHIVSVLRSTGGIVEGPRGAATKLGLHPNTLRSRMKRLGVSTASTQA